jgi:hypothetical protein
MHSRYGRRRHFGSQVADAAATDAAWAEVRERRRERE